MEGVLSFFDQAAFHTIFDVSELDSAIPDRASAEVVEQVGFLHHIGGESHALAKKEALVAIEIAHQFGVWANLCILFYQSANGGRKARGEATGGEKSDLRHGYVYYKDKGDSEPDARNPALTTVRFEPVQASSARCPVTNPTTSRCRPT